MLRIGVLQVIAGCGLLLLLGADPALVLAGQVACGVPATHWRPPRALADRRALSRAASR
jgi:hypothetical protein